MSKQISVIIVAAGSSNRMGMNTNKIFWTYVDVL